LPSLNPNATYEQSSIHPNSRCRGAGKGAMSPQGIYRLTPLESPAPQKGDVTPAGEKFCEILRQLGDSYSRKNKD
jgi:hypothetical protein